ncbi:MAG: type II toxin-antitoxin system RelE/ParE family toxin [Bryobacteraceae bacterium]
MDFKVILTESALSDFESLMNWSRDNYPASSEKFGTALLNHLDLLKAFPLIGRPVRGFPSVRRLLHSPLYVYYRLDEPRGAIEILHFWHASRRAPKL